jgi:hypothetical protein
MMELLLGGIAVLVGALGLLAKLFLGERKRRHQAEDEALHANQRADVQKSISEGRAEARREAAEHEQKKAVRRRSGERPSGNFGDRL